MCIYYPCIKSLKSKVVNNTIKSKQIPPTHGGQFMQKGLASWGGKMAQWLSTPTAFAKDQSSVPRTHIQAYNNLCFTVPGNLTPPLSSVGTCIHVVQRHALGNRYICITIFKGCLFIKPFFKCFLFCELSLIPLSSQMPCLGVYVS